MGFFEVVGVLTILCLGVYFFLNLLEILVRAFISKMGWSFQFLMWMNHRKQFKVWMDRAGMDESHLKDLSD